MRERRWLGVLVALMACGLIAAGCGSNDNTSSDATGADTTATSGDTKTADDVYNACLDAIDGKPGAKIAKAGCQAAKTAFEQCAKQAEGAPDSAKDAALQACRKAADIAISALNSAG